MLGLKLPTDPRWVNLASITLEEILTDHAFCEQKAATQCISLIQKYPEKDKLVNELAPIVTEEWGHFRQVLAEMRKRGYSLGRQRSDEYVQQLLQHQQKGGRPEDQLLDKLLTCALIEARSCERFRLLSEGLEDTYLRAFYHRFMVSEAGHYRVFLDLAKEYSSAEQVKSRWQEWLKIEGGIISKLEPRGNRMH